MHSRRLLRIAVGLGCAVGLVAAPAALTDTLSIGEASP